MPYEVVHHDNLQSVLGLSGHDGTVLQTISYDPFGNITSTTGNSNNNQLHYTGREQDPDTGLYNYRARIYDPSIGRFCTEDPKGFAAGVNFYVYALNNPINANDPYGLDVTITVNRVNYTENSVTGTFTAASDVTGNSYSGVTIETTHAGDNGDKPPIPPDVYDAYVRTMSANGVPYNPNRIQLINVPGYTGVQLHIGNSPDDVEGCIAVGTEQTEDDYITGSRSALVGINNIIKEDNTGNITVVVNGSSYSPSSDASVGAAAAGGFLIYPNMPNTNMMQSVYHK